MEAVKIRTLHWWTQTGDFGDGVDDQEVSDKARQALSLHVLALAFGIILVDHSSLYFLHV